MKMTDVSDPRWRRRHRTSRQDRARVAGTRRAEAWNLPRVPVLAGFGTQNRLERPRYSWRHPWRRQTGGVVGGSPSEASLRGLDDDHPPPELVHPHHPDHHDHPDHPDRPLKDDGLSQMDDGLHHGTEHDARDAAPTAMRMVMSRIFACRPGMMMMYGPLGTLELDVAETVEVAEDTGLEEGSGAGARTRASRAWRVRGRGEQTTAVA